MKRLLLGLVAATAVVCALLGPGPFIPVAASAESIEVRIDSVLPAVPKAKSTLRISGEVVNSGELPIVDPIVQLRFSPRPLTARSEVPAVLAGTTDRTGTPIGGSAKSLGPELQPGQSVSFETAVKISDLGLAPVAAVYAVFVEALAGVQPLGRSGSTLPWFPRGSEYAPSGIAMLWPMTQMPAVAANDLVLDPALPGEFAAGGRLDTLRTAAAGAPVSWLVDTATLQTAGELGNGYRVLTTSGPEEVSESSPAQAFRSELAAELAGKQVALTQFAIDDADALERVGLTPFVVRSASLPSVLGGRQLNGSSRSDAFLAPGGRVGKKALSVLVDAGIRRVIISDRAQRPNPKLNYTPTGAFRTEQGDGSVEFLLTDSQLSEELGGELDTAHGRSTATQAVLADLAMLTLERPNEPRTVVGLPPLTWNPPGDWAAGLLDRIQDAPWIDMVDLDSVAAGPLVERSSLRYGEKAKKAELPGSYMKRLKGLTRQLNSLTRIVDDPVGFGDGFTLALQRAASSLWREDRAGRNRMLETIAHQVDAERQKVQVVSAGSVTLAGDNGILPLTIANDLDRDVTVGVELRTENQIRLLYDPPDPVRVKASQKTGLEVPIRVVGSQPLEVTVALTDKEGQFYDESVSLELQSTAASRIAGILAGAAALVLFILVGIRLLRRRRNG